MYLSKGVHEAKCCISEEGEGATEDVIEELLRGVGFGRLDDQAREARQQAAAQHYWCAEDIHLPQHLVHLLQDLLAQWHISANAFIAQEELLRFVAGAG